MKILIPTITAKVFNPHLHPSDAGIVHLDEAFGHFERAVGLWTTLGPPDLQQGVVNALWRYPGGRNSINVLSDMRASTSFTLWGWSDSECEREGTGQSEDLRGKKRNILLRPKLTFAPNGGWTTIRNCGWSFNAGSWMSVLPCRLHHRPPIWTEAWQLGTLPCEEGGVS